MEEKTRTKRQGCRGYGDSHGDSHGYGCGMGMGTMMNPHGSVGIPWGLDFRMDSELRRNELNTAHFFVI